MEKLVALLFVLFHATCSAFGQIHCGSLRIQDNTPISTSFTFDSFSAFNGGMTVNNVATLKLRIEDQAIPDPDCKWFLYMEITNNPGAGTAANEWEERMQYGLGTAPTPSIDILQIRIRNACQTSPIDGVFQTFTNNGDLIDIIADLLPLTTAGSCSQNVNGPGDYLSNYDEYTFTIDVRINPGMVFSPGIYELNLRFHLEEQM